MKVCLCHFDQRIGPCVLFSSERLAPGLESRIVDLMDLQHNQGMVEHNFVFNNVCEVRIMNYAFQLESPWARGNHELLTVCLVLDAHHETKIYKSLIEEFIARIKSHPKIYKGLHDADERKDPECETNREIIHALFSEFAYKAEDLMKNTISGDFFIMGDDDIGKNKFFKTICPEKVEKPAQETLETQEGNGFEIKRLAQDNMQFRMYEIPGDEQFQNMWLESSEIPDGLIYIIDGSKDLRNAEIQKKIKENMSKITNKFVKKHGKASNIPVLVMVNQSETMKKDPDLIKKIFSLKNSNFKENIIIFSCDNKTNITESMKWLIGEYYKKHYNSISNKAFANKFDKFMKNF